MRCAGWLLAAIGAAFAGAAASTSGCALFYNYGDYHGKGSGGAAGATTSSAQGGHGGGSGAAGGAGGRGGAPPACPADTTPDAYALTWADVYGNGHDVAIAGVRADATGNTSIAATFTGKIDVGPTKNIDGGDKKALLVARFDPTGAPQFAEAFSGDGDVVATALALAQSGGDPYAFATFTGQTAVGTDTYVDPGNGSTFSFEVGVDKGTGHVVQTREISCQPYAAGPTYCQVSIAAADLQSTGLYLAGSFVGTVLLDDAPHMAAHQLSTAGTDGFASEFGMHQYQLAGVDGVHAMTGFFPSNGGTSYTLVGTVQGPSAFCGGSTDETNHDLFAMNIGSDFMTSEWSCPGILQAPGEQFLDAAVPLLAASPFNGDVVIAGRTDGDLDIPPTPLNGTEAGVFVARLHASNGNVVWQKVFPMKTLTPAHLDVSADGSLLLLSGSFNGMITDEGMHSISSHGSDNGFVAVVDVTTGGLTWLRTVQPCDSESGPTSALAAWADSGGIAVAGFVNGSSMLSGGRIDVADAGTHFYVARIDKKKP